MFDFLKRKDKAEPNQPVEQPLPVIDHAPPTIIAEPVAVNEPAKTGWLQRLQKGLNRSSQNLQSGLTELLLHRKLDEGTLADLEELLIGADLGVKAAGEIIAEFDRNKFGQNVTMAEVKQTLAELIAKRLAPFAKPLYINLRNKPEVLLIVGVNGAGKTTTIAKLAQQWQQEGKKIMLVAGDTFRAAAGEQLAIWAQRTSVKLLQRENGSAKQQDSAGLVYDALQQAENEGYDIVLIDTAGRQPNKADLMAELSKIVRVAQKVIPAAPHHALLILDATIGQNGLAQAAIFKEAVGLTGLIITKLDGTAKAGIVLPIALQTQLPIHAIGVGETPDDLKQFDADDFAKALLGL